MEKAKIKVPTLILFVIILTSSAFGRFLFAQSESEFSQQLLQIYQTSSNKIDTLITFIAMIATIFGIIVAIVVGFFAIRQLSVDREIKEYKKEIKEQKELIKRETVTTRKELTNLRKWAMERKGEIQKALGKPIPKKTKEELKRLEIEIDKLKEEIAYRQGSMSTISGSGLGVSLGPRGNITVEGTHTARICSKCGKVYTEDSTKAMTLYSECPYCGHPNLKDTL